MNNSLVPFDFENNVVRTVTNDNKEIWFVAADVSKALGYLNTAQTVQKHVDNDDKVYLTDIGGISEVYVPNSLLLINVS